MLIPSASGQWNPIASTATTPAIPSAAESGNNAIQGRELIVHGTLAGKLDAGNLLLYFDAATAGFLWRFEPARGSSPAEAIGISRPWFADRLASRGFIFAAHEGLFLFEPFPGELRLTRPGGKATSLDDAQSQALKLLATHAANIPGRSLPRPWPPGRVNLDPLMSRFGVVGLYAIPGYPTIQSVARQGVNWVIVMRYMGKIINLVVAPDLSILNASVVSVLPKK